MRRRFRGASSSEPRSLAALSALGWLLLLGVAFSAAGGQAAQGWASGPVRWLLLPSEKRQLRKLQDGRDVVQFIEEFWRRRDPDPSEPGNPFLETFFERVQAADRIYSEEDLRGSLTDRGGALILLGPPPILRQERRRGPRYQPLRAGGKEEERARWVVVEVWEYPLDTLPEPLLHQLPKDSHSGIVLTFIEGHHRTHLTDGEKALERAARAAIRSR